MSANNAANTQAIVNGVPMDELHKLARELESKIRDGMDENEFEKGIIALGEAMAGVCQEAEVIGQNRRQPALVPKFLCDNCPAENKQVQLPARVVKLVDTTDLKSVEA